MYPRTVMRGNSPLTTYIRLLQNWLFFASSLKIYIFHYSCAGRRQVNRTRGKAYRAHERAPLLNLSTPVKSLAPYIPLISRQINLYTAPRRSTSPCASGGTFLLRCAEFFLHVLTLFFLCYCHYGRWRRGIFERRRRMNEMRSSTRWGEWGGRFWYWDWTYGDARWWEEVRRRILWMPLRGGKWCRSIWHCWGPRRKGGWWNGCWREGLMRTRSLQGVGPRFEEGWGWRCHWQGEGTGGGDSGNYIVQGRGIGQEGQQ